MTCIPVGDRMGLYFLLQSAAKAIKMAMAVDRLGNIMKNSGVAAISLPSAAKAIKMAWP